MSEPDHDVDPGREVLHLRRERSRERRVGEVELEELGHRVESRLESAREVAVIHGELVERGEESEIRRQRARHRGA